MTDTALFATGSYSRSGSGRGTGIGVVEVELGAGSSDRPVSGARTLVELPAEDPSFVCWSADGSLLYAVQETTPSRLLAIAVSPDGRTAEIRADLGLRGAGACHLAPGRAAGTLVVAHFGSGEVESVGLDAAGLPVATIDVHDHHEGAEGFTPHPHQVRALAGSDLLAVPDLGLDRVLLYRQDLAGRLELSGQIPFPRGSGPRHLDRDHESSQLYVSCELSGAVAVARREQVEVPAGGLQMMRAPEHVWPLSTMAPATDTGEGSAVSHLELTVDEDFLLVANRGPDTLAVFSLSGVRPQIVSEQPVGRHPRHFAQLRGPAAELVLVAAQEDDRIDVLHRVGSQLMATSLAIPAPSVSCVAPRP